MTSKQSASQVFDDAKYALEDFIDKNSDVISQYLSLQEDVDLAESQLKEVIKETRENAYTRFGVYRYVPVWKKYIDYAEALNSASPEEKKKIQEITTITANVDMKKFDDMVKNLEIRRDVWVKAYKEEPMKGRVNFIKTKEEV